MLLDNKIIEEKISVKKLDIDDPKFKTFYLKNSENIVRLQSHKNKVAEKKSRKLVDEVFVNINEKGAEVGLYYNGQVITPLKQGIKKVYQNQTFTNDLGMLLCDFWSDIDFQNTQNEGGTSFPAGKKPEILLHRIIEMATKENDIVLDYHIGSGTTAAVAHKMGRQYIGIEQLDYDENDSTVRLQNVIGRKQKKDDEMFDKVEYDQSGISKAVNWQGGGDFIYTELKKYNQTFIEQIKEAKTTNELLTIWEQMKEKSFLDYNLDIKKQDTEMDSFRELPLNEQKQHLVEILDKNQMYVNLSSIDDKDFEVSEEDKKLTNDFYAIKK